LASHIGRSSSKGIPFLSINSSTGTCPVLAAIKRMWTEKEEGLLVNEIVRVWSDPTVHYELIVILNHKLGAR
jgi:hypothetical protein